MLAGQIIRFGCVGAAASTVHFGVVAALVPLGLSPLVANFAAFSVAYHVSYCGHSRWTFGCGGSLQGYVRMLLLAALSFGVNEGFYWLLLQHTDWDYRVSLIATLLIVALGTFVTARCWAFPVMPSLHKNFHGRGVVD
jgi:putative flippase GtrA